MDDKDSRMTIPFMPSYHTLYPEETCPSHVQPPQLVMRFIPFTLIFFTLIFFPHVLKYFKCLKSEFVHCLTDPFNKQVRYQGFHYKDKDAILTFDFFFLPL